ncbi:Putative DNA-binding domain-containing protein [Actinacidiphila alni]|uniref:Putative DNA-binding domain-containing protein n=1 Tax=Actinacidiphila alni TaxID=380248 RepID=A0A1I2MUZ3_9ACTN|nr:ATP-binding protein [Actinacidiphila alni]SFF93146.1 Putative DNA-binding domain-containing protein [Actinacidiphila alni]
MFDARLRTLLGAAPGEATYAQYLTLLKNPSAAEAADVDYKGEQYGSRANWPVELAKDVAALANAAGGTLVLGLREDRATSIPQYANPEELTDQLRKKYRETLVLRLDPPVDCDIHFIPEDDSVLPPRGLVVISVPPSARMPHAVVGTADLRDGTLCFPYRNDNHTAFMNLTQVKRAIAASTSVAAGRHDVLEAAQAAVITDGRALAEPRIAVTITPDLPGAFPIDSASFHAFRQELAAEELPYYGPGIFQSFGVGPRRFIASQSDSRSRHVAHFHADGTAAWVTEGPVVRAFVASDSAFADTVESWNSDGVVIGVLVILQYLAVHAARRAAASGTATARLIMDTGPNQVAYGLASNHASSAHVVFSATEQHSATGEAGVLIDAGAKDGPGLVQAAASLLAGCYQHFGVVEAEQLTLDGRINLSAWAPRNRDMITAWADAAGVEVLTGA